MSDNHYTEPGWYVIECQGAEPCVQEFDQERLGRYYAMKPEMPHVEIRPATEKERESQPMTEFNPSCVCGGSVDNPNDDCERCRMQDELATLRTLREEIEKLRDEYAKHSEQLFKKAKRDGGCTKTANRAWDMETVANRLTRILEETKGNETNWREVAKAMSEAHYPMKDECKFGTCCCEICEVYAKALRGEVQE